MIYHLSIIYHLSLTVLLIPDREVLRKPAEAGKTKTMNFKGSILSFDETELEY